MIRKLRLKFIAVSLLSVFLVLLVIMGSINVMNYLRVVDDSNSVLAVLAQNGGSFPDRRELWGGKMNKFGNSGDFSRFSGDFSPELAYESRYFTAKLDCQGNVTSVDTGMVAAVDSEEAAKLAQEVWQRGRTEGFKGNYRYLRQSDGDNGTMLIFLDCRRNLTSFRSFLLYSLFGSAGGMLAFAALVVLLSRSVMKPVQESYEKQKSFITDAGHEIKTPLTIINADTEILAMDCGEDNEWIADIRAQTARLAALTKDLIYLSRMEESQNTVQMIDFPISDVTAETAQSFQSLAKVQEKTFDVDIQPMLSYCGDEKALIQLVSILLDNALKYSDAKGRIALSLHAKGKGVCLTVFNTAESVDVKSLERLFDRFYRADASRNSETGGYGIGLSIAKAVAEAHKGKIAATSEDGKSLTMTVTLP